MTIDISAARDFMATHARVLDRRRFEHLNGRADPSVSSLQISPAGSLDWRGYATVSAIDVLRRNGRA